MPFFFCQLPDDVREIECREEVGKCEHAFETGNAIYTHNLPIRELRKKTGDLLLGSRLSVASTRNTLGG